MVSRVPNLAKPFNLKKVRVKREEVRACVIRKTLRPFNPSTYQPKRGKKERGKGEKNLKKLLTALVI